MMLWTKKTVVKRLILTSIITSGFIICAPWLNAKEVQKLKCEIISVEYTAWATKTQGSVKSTLDVGDVLVKGDVLEVKKGNTVQLAFDSKQENILHIEGPARMEITQLGHTKLELEEGKVFALLDGLKKGQSFIVSTPTAIASVRGTQYQINTHGLSTVLSVYKGVVKVQSRLKDGTSSAASVNLGIGQKLEFDGYSQKPAEPKDMTLDETSEVSEILWATKKTKSHLKDLAFESDIEVSEEWDMKQDDKSQSGEGNAVIY